MPFNFNGWWSELTQVGLKYIVKIIGVNELVDLWLQHWTRS